MKNENTFRKLLVWQKSMKLVSHIYNELKSFPRDEMYGLSAQLKRTAVSIPSNIAEGYGRDGKKDYLRFLNITLSSLYELQTQIEIAYNLNFLNIKKFEEIYENSREVERMLTSFIRKIKD